MKKVGFRFLPRRLRVTPRSQRKILLVGIAIIILVVSMATVAICLAIAAASSDTSDRLAEIADVFAGATLILAIAAAVVALLAYAVSTGSPDLRIQIDFPFSALNKPSFKSETQDGMIKADDFKQVFCTVRVRNDSSYSAKNPAIVIRLWGMAFSPSEQDPLREWVIVHFATSFGATEVQWDGGSNYSIHGGSIRILPELHLHNLHTRQYGLLDPTMVIDILADGYSRQVKIPVSFRKMSLNSGEPSTRYGRSEDQWI